MKKITIILSLLAVGFLTGCKQTICTVYFTTYEFNNQSGHTVAIVPVVGPMALNPPKFDSLVLQHGEKASWIDDDYVYQALEPYAQGRVYYDGRYKLDAASLPKNRILNKERAFETTYKDGESYMTYTFTAEDYAYAVEHGTDLQPES